MTDWIVIHSLASYARHSDLVGKTEEEAPSWLKEMKRGERLVYYAEGDRLVMDIGEINSEIQRLEEDEFWPGCWVRNFRSFFPLQKGQLLTLEELKRVSPTARSAVFHSAYIKLPDGEFDKILAYAKKKFP